MANQKIFCNTPWYEAHIYWDGSLGICCQESRHLSTDPKYNIKNMSLTEWFNSQPVRDFRKKLLSNTPTDICSWCTNEEVIGGYSRRHRSNQKSVIFTRTAFISSYEQSPGYKHFKYSKLNQGLTNTLPIDLHIDLGNYCNLACKMCWSGASSTIAVQQVKWGIDQDQQYLSNDWTKDREVWTRVLNELLDIPKLKNIHFMGGETLLTSRFEEFVDFMTQHGRFDICFSFVTNGTVFNESLINKLKKFTRVGIEISIETVTSHNGYVRQGTDTDLVLANLEKYHQYCNNTSITITVRPTISALTIGYYHTLLEYCLENQLLIKSLLVTHPTWLNVNILPHNIRSSYLGKYHALLAKLSDINIDSDYNESDPNNYLRGIKIQCLQAIGCLESKQPIDSDQQLKIMVEHCRKWDPIYKYNALDLYPELAEIFKKYGY
jgi:sulfatase maturation enzyme AslB (radical SAM superfamily)